MSSDVSVSNYVNDWFYYMLIQLCRKCYLYDSCSAGWLNSGGCQVMVTHVALWLETANEWGGDVTPGIPLSSSSVNIQDYQHLKI
jgi:hypothetical protein